METVIKIIVAVCFAIFFIALAFMVIPTIEILGILPLSFTIPVITVFVIIVVLIYRSLFKK